MTEQSIERLIDHIDRAGCFMDFELAMLACVQGVAHEIRALSANPAALADLALRLDSQAPRLVVVVSNQAAALAEVLIRARAARPDP
jgi:hypothetical protein